MVLYAEKQACQAKGCKMNIRQAVSKDSLLLSSLSMDVQRLHAENYPDTFKVPKNDNYAAAFFDEMLADPQTSIFIAEDENGKVLGYILCKLVEREENPFTFASRHMLIDQISVRTAAQRQGIGKALINQAVMLAKGLNVTKIQLISWDFNKDAHAVFEKMGFEKFSHRFWRDV